MRRFFINIVVLNYMMFVLGYIRLLDREVEM